MSHALFHNDLVLSNRILYTPSAFARTSLNHLQEIGELQAQKPHISRRENLSSFLCFMVISGSGKLVYNGTACQLSAGDMVFIDCRIPYSHESSDPDLWQLKWVHFYGPTVSEIYQKYMERGGQPYFHPKNIRKFEILWETMYRTAGSDDHIRDMRLNEQLTGLLTCLMEESWHPDFQQTHGKEKDLMEIRSYLDENYTKKITLDQLSERYFINKYYLTRIFREQFGVSINNYILEKRITHAKQLLRFTDQTVEEIGEACGMGALYYFSRMFKKIEGVSPSEYRKLW